MSENQLIQKAYYERFLLDNQIAHPIRVLGDAYMMEQQNEIPDLAYIRFAQGEVYFHNKDFEAAIFKWENIHNELEPWARKNMADAFFKLELYQNAEEMYKSITTDTVILNTEIGLQLFALYIEQGKIEQAFTVIKKVVLLNPDYPNVTEMARNFYEEQQDWDSAVNLVAGEAIRTEYLHWFDFLKNYIENGYSKTIAPAFFTKVMKVLYSVDPGRFEGLIMVIAENYKNGESYFAWIQTMNEIFIELEVPHRHSSTKLFLLFKETFVDLMNGRYLVNQLQKVVPQLLTNWLKVTETSIASSAILAWNETFPGCFTAGIINEAEHRFLHSENHQISIKELNHFFATILSWTENLDIEFGARKEWLIDELTDLRKHHLLVAEMNGNEKSSFINMILGESVAKSETSAMVLYQYQRDMEITEITDSEMKVMEDISEFQMRSTVPRQWNEDKTIIDFRCPSPFLFNHKLAVIDCQSFVGNRYSQNEMLYELHMADSMFFLLNGNESLIDKEMDVLLKIREQMPNLRIHFISKMDTLQNSKQQFENTKSRVKAFFPQAKVLPFSAEGNSNLQDSILTQIKEIVSHLPGENERVEKILYFLRKAITELLEKRIEVEKNLQTTIQWTDEMLSKLNGAIHQLKDLEDEKIGFIKNSFNERMETIENELRDNIPKILRGCSNLLSEESDFGNIHHELNEEMNDRIQDYLEDHVLETFNSLLQEWIAYSKEELEKSQTILDDRSDSFNILFGENKVQLECDFKIINDWLRDTDRMTSGVMIDKVNIFPKFTPTQFLLKSAGKLFGSIGQNKTLFHNKYKAYIETENFQEATNTIIKKFLQPFELFEKGLTRDLKLFYKQPFRILQETERETLNIKRINEDALRNMNESPELFEDPLKVFEIRLRQYEWMIVAAARPPINLQK
ncbi:GTP-binding protein [Bacillus sp. CGMCC 1.16607]|uniref:GTP-binding protein n=1 Tax=Bacillus sp. CGMCC 1.16607 TaxID=3351842 RepID=UPI00362F0092